MIKMEHFLECIGCKKRYSSNEVIYRCRYCSDLVDVKYDYDKIKENTDEDLWLNRPISVWRYQEILPIEDLSKIVSLGEGGTNLHKCERLGKILGLEDLYVKNEGENPTGSFKDRGMTVGVSRAIELGFSKVACASTGNTSASLSAYAAKAGIEAHVFIPSGKIALGKLVQAIIHGAHIIEVEGNFDDALKSVFALTDSRNDMYLLNSINPYRLEGQKTLAYEIYHQLMGELPDVILLPVGNAGNISAIWKGLVELRRLGFTEKLPRMIGIQASGAAPLAMAFKQGQNEIELLKNPETVATAIRIGFPVNWKKALNAVRASGGTMETVTDEEILDAQRILARTEGLFVEPASASSIAGFKKLMTMGLINKSEKVVCVTTGHGLKDPETIIKTYQKAISEDKLTNVLLH